MPQNMTICCLYIGVSLTIFATATSFADDKRVSIPSTIAINEIEFEPRDENATTFAAQQPVGDFQSLFKDAGDAAVSFTLVDLNGDGQPEEINVLSGLNTCGIRDCQVIIFSPIQNGKRTIFDSTASSISLGPTVNGWRQIITNVETTNTGKRTGVFWEWKDDKYEIK